MKIAMIGLRGIPAKYGGVENVVENVSVELVNLGHKVTVYCRSKYCPDKIKEYKGIHLKYFPSIYKKHTETISHTFLCSLDALFCNYDIVHFHSMGNALFSFLPRLTGKKTLLTLHGLDYEREKWGSIAKKFLKWNEKLSLVFPNRITSVSENIKEYYYDRYKKDIEYIPNGVNFYENLELNKLKRFNLKKGYILFLSRIVPEKGLHYLIESFKKIKTKKQLVIVGDAAYGGDYFKKVEEMAKNDKRIIFTGPLFYEEKQEAFSNASVFVLPSTMEGMPVVLLEAMSYGLPVLASDIKANKETGKNFINYFKYMDSESLKDNLIYMLKNYSKIKENSLKNKKYIADNYNWKSIAKKYAEIYERMKIEK